MSSELHAAARLLVADAKNAGVTVATAESCTGGMIAAALTSVPGSSAVLDRGFVAYSNESKNELLDVPVDLITSKGAVSAEVARAMAEGALKRSRADIVVSVTGIAGPDGGSANKPVGLVHLAAARRGGPRLHEEKHYGAIGREEVRLATALDALALIRRLL